MCFVTDCKPVGLNRTKAVGLRSRLYFRNWNVFSTDFRLRYTVL